MKHDLSTFRSTLITQALLYGQGHDQQHTRSAGFGNWPTAAHRIQMNVTSTAPAPHSYIALKKKKKKKERKAKNLELL